MAVLMLWRRIVITGLAMLGSRVVTEHAIVAGDFVRESSIGQAIERTVQSDAIHICQLVLHILMR